MIFIRKFLLLIPILLLILIGCSTNQTLEPPTNFRYESGFLYWTEIPSADHYVIEINGVTKLAYNNKLDLKDYPTANYTTRIATFSKGKLSSFSSYIQFQLIQQEQIENITLTSTNITWDLVVGLTYQVKITNVSTNQVIQSLNLLESTFNYKNLEPGLYEFEIQLLLDTHVVSTKVFRVDTNTYEYVRNAGMVIEHIPDALYVGQQILALDVDYTTDEYGILIDSDYIDALEGLGFVLMGIADEIPTYCYVNLVIIAVPEIISSNSVTYNGNDISFLFNLSGGTFNGLGGNNIAGSDYTFSGSTLTIHASYINNIIATEPTRKTLILTYVLQNDPHVVIGYLFITLP